MPICWFVTQHKYSLMYGYGAHRSSGHSAPPNKS